MNPPIYPFTPLAGVTVAGAEAHGSVTLPNAPTVFELNVPGGAGCVMLQARTQPISYTLQGSAPTTTAGFLMATADPPIIVPISGTTRLKFVAATNGAVLQYEFGK